MFDLINIEELYENAPCGYFSFLPDGKIIKANKTFLTWIGISNEELQNFQFLDLLFKGNKIYYEMIFLPMLKMQGYLHEINFEIIKKDKTTFPALINAVAVRDEKENLIAVNVTLINITDRKKYETKLLSAKNEADNERLKFETLANQIPDIIWTSTDAGKIDFLNKQYYALTGNDANQKSLFIEDIIYEKDLTVFKIKWDEAREINAPFELEVRLRTQSHDYDWYLLKGVPYIRDAYSANKERSWLGTLTNINQQVKSLQAKDDFISIASHELKTPITIMKSYLEILKDVVPDDTQKALISKCESGVESMQELIENLLDISQINATELPINKEKEELMKILTNCVSNYEMSNVNHKIQLTGDLHPVHVFVDKPRMEQVINNLLGNAIKYSPDADTVILNIEKATATGKVKISVRDFGIGIPEQDLSKIFDRYFRVKTKKLSLIKGWGLGLFIIQQIVKAHNSIIQVESELGKGSCFYFELDYIE